MKKLFVVLLGVMFLSGCGAAARESGYYQHDTMYKDWEHLKFSLCGYKEVDKKEAQLSTQNKWWGIDVTKTK